MQPMRPVQPARCHGVLVTPASLLIVNYLCYPLQLPVVVGNVSGMAVASVVAFILCKRFPSWVRQCREPTPVEPVVNKPDYGVVWTLRRVLADFSPVEAAVELRSEASQPSLRSSAASAWSWLDSNAATCLR